MCADETADVAATVTAVLGAAFGAGVPPWFSVEAIMSANIRLQLAFLSSLFRVAPGLDYESASGTLESEVPSSSKGLGFDNAPLHGTWLFGIDSTEPCVFEQDLLQLPLPLYRNRQELLHHRVSVGFVFFFSSTVSFLGVISITAAGWARKSSKASIPGKPRIQLDAGHVAKLEADLAVLVKEVSSTSTVFPAWFCELLSFVAVVSTGSRG
jgi:hypothetical protein